MDRKDFELLAALYVDARRSYRSLGGVVSLSAPAVRDRLKRMANLGILNGYWLWIDSGVFNRDDLLVFYEGEWSRQKAMLALTAPDVAWVAWKVDGGLTIQIWSNNQTQSLEGLSAVLRARPSGQALTPQRNHGALSSIDWQIMDALVDDPKIPLGLLIGVTGLSPKTIRKHLKALFQAEVISVVPRLGGLVGSGELVFHLAVVGPVPIGRLHDTLGDSFLVNSSKEPPLRYLLCRGSDLADVTAKLQEVKKLPGVVSANITLNRELVPGKAFTHSLIREKLHQD